MSDTDLLQAGFLKKEVTIVGMKTMADGTIRLSVDLLDSQADDLSIAFKLKFLDTTMILAPTKVIDADSRKVEIVED
jgi:hypothetical protein